MDLSAWRNARKQTKQVTLPSGLDVEVQPVGFGAFLRMQIPDHLTPIVSSMFEGKGLGMSQSLEDMRRYFELLDLVALAAIVSPKIVSSSDLVGDGEICVDELTEEDKAALMPLLGATAKSLESFRIEPAADVDAVLSVESDEPAAE